MKKICITFTVFLTLLAFTGCENKKTPNTDSNVSVNRTSTSITNNNIIDNQNPIENSTSNTLENPSNTNENNNPTQDNNTDVNQPPANPPAQTESVASEFTTQIKTKSSNRANNIQLTCSKINDVVVKAGETFSFCETTGKSTEADGYKKADVIVGEKVIQALGGGNCQVSSTLYNAVLAVPDLEVTERHPHGKKVNYVPEGKDAAIAHGNKDFKFKNNSTKDLKIYATSDGKTVYIKLVFLG